MRIAVNDTTQARLVIVASLSASLAKRAGSKKGTLKTYKDFPHGMITTQADVINADLLAFFKS